MKRTFYSLPLPTICVKLTGTPCYDEKGCYFQTENGRTLYLSFRDCLEIADALADAVSADMDRWEYYNQVSEALEAMEA